MNPDFSQVESDASSSVRSAAALFFPEKRPFFLDGIELFTTPNNLIYTRRIVDPDRRGEAHRQGRRARNLAVLFAVDGSGRRRAARSSDLQHPPRCSGTSARGRAPAWSTPIASRASIEPRAGGGRAHPVEQASTASSSRARSAAPGSGQAASRRRSGRGSSAATAGAIGFRYSALRHRRRLPRRQRLHRRARHRHADAWINQISAYGQARRVLESCPATSCSTASGGTRTSCSGPAAREEAALQQQLHVARADGRPAPRSSSRPSATTPTLYADYALLGPDGRS